MADVVLSFTNGVSGTASSASCANARALVNAHFVATGNTGYSATACSADPVVAGSTVTVCAGSSCGAYTLASVTAVTPPTSMDSGFVVAALIVLLLWAMGYQSGRSAA